MTKPWSAPHLLQLLAALVLLALAASASAQTCTIAGTGARNWNTAANWNCTLPAGSRVPTSTDNVVIINNSTVTVDTAAVAASVTINGGASATALNLGGVGTSLSVSGNVVINPSTANVTRSLAVGARALTVGGSVTINGGSTTGGAANIGQLTVTSGTAGMGSLTINSGTVNTSVARATVTTGTINVAGDVTLNGGITSNTRDVLLSVTGISPVGAGVNIGGNLDIKSTLAGTSSVTMTSTGRITVTGNVTNGDTLTVGAGTFTANGASFVTTNNLINTTTSVTSGTLAIAGNASVAGGTTNPSGATMSVTTGILTVGGDLAITAGSNNLAIATTSVTTGRITVNGNTTVTGGAAGGRNALLTASNNPAVGGNGINLNGALTIVANAAAPATTATVSMTTAGVINVAGNVNNGGTVTIGTGTFSVTNAASTYTNSSAAVAATTTISSGTLNVPGNLSNAAGDMITVTGAGNINLGGDWSNDGTFNQGTGTVTFNGTGAQALGGAAATTFNNLTINKTTGDVTVTSTSAALSPTVNGTLTLTSGKVITTAGTNDLGLGTAGTVSGGNATSYVVGAVQKNYAGTSTLTFPVGDASNYTPVVIQGTAGFGAGNLTITTTGGDHGSIATSGIDATKSVNRYWTLTAGGGLAGTYNATFNYINGSPVDYDSGATPANFIVEQWDGANWFPTTLNATCAATPGTNLCERINAETGFGDFAIGEPIAGFPPVLGTFNAFDTTAPAGVVIGNIQTKQAGIAFTLRLVRILNNAINAGYNQAGVTVELYDASDNTGAYVGTTACRSTWTAIAGTSQTVTFAAGVVNASFSVPNVYRDTRVHIVKGGAGAGEGCSSDRFAIRPQSLTISAADTDWASAGIVRVLDNSGNVHKAATAASPLPFTLRVTPVPATATNYDGNPTVVAGFPTCGTLCTTVGGLSFTAGSWTGVGVRDNATANYSDVGTFNLQLEDTSYASVDAADGSSAATRTVPATATVEIGRFVPDHFVVATNNTPQFKTFNDTACGSRTFTYIGQPFGYVTTPEILVTAKNLAGLTTANYANTLWKIAAAAPTKDCTTSPDICTVVSGSVTQVYTYAAVPVATPNWDDSQVSILAPTVAHPLNDGTGTVTGNAADVLAFKRNLATPQAPFTASIALAASVKDTSEAGNCGVAGAGACDIASTAPAQFNPIAFDSGSDFRYGRLKLANAYGSELLPLRVPVRAEYFNGTNWTLNTADNCTSLPANAFALSGGIAANTSASAVTLSGGSGTLILAKPSPVAAGSVDVAADLGASGADQSCLASHGGTAANKPWLQFAWCSGKLDPNARVKFGSPKAPYIYLRERY